MAKHIPKMILMAALLLGGGCSEDDPVSVGCPGPSVAGLTPVENLTIADHPVLHATVSLSWQSPLPNPANLAVDRYEIRVDTEGKTITEDTWCALPVLGTIPLDDKIGFFAQFDHQDEGIVPGATESFAVRPIYSNGDLGPVGTVLTHRVTAPFTVAGLVRDDTGAPIPDMTVRLVEPDLIPGEAGVTLSAVTGADGRFAPLGPISDQAKMVVATDSPDTLTTPEAEDSYFDFTTEPLSPGADDITITLVTRYVFEYKPDGYVADYFISWVQMMVNAAYIEADYRIRKWDSYDLKVYVPEGMNNEGTIDMAADCREALAKWNSELGITVFTETDDPALAQVEVVFEEMYGFNGRVILDKPEGHSFDGRIIPERAFVKMDPSITRAEVMQGVFLHEFGHILGIIRHSGSYQHLMSTGGYCCLGRDELRLVHTIMNLPQNCLMSNFEKGLPWPFP